MNDTTVSDWYNPPEAWVDVTVTLASWVVAVAIQISAVPSCVLTRLTNVHDSPAPDTVSVWVAEVGPSDAANATKISPAADVLNDGVACVPAAVGGDDLVDGEGLG